MITHSVQLEGGQRELYENVRLAVHEQVREAIAESGWGRSHIYEAWRAGERDFLDQELFGDSQQSRALLEQEAAYATDLGLEADLFSYSRWSGGEGNKRRFSPDHLFDRLFHTRYRKPADVPQLDLFMDATGVTLVNGVIGALIEREHTEARRLLERLLDADPGNHQIDDLELLTEAAEGLQRPLEDASAGLDRLEQTLMPFASDRLGAGSRSD